MILRAGPFVDKMKAGPSRLRRSIKGRYISLDIVLPGEVWRGKPRSEVSTCLINYIDAGFHLAVNRMVKDKLTVDSCVFDDFGQLKHQFLSVFCDL